MPLESLYLLCKEKAIHLFYAVRMLSSLGPNSSQMIQETMEICIVVSPHFSLFLGKTDFEISVPKAKGTMQTYISDRKKKQTSAMLWVFISTNG